MESILRNVTDIAGDDRRGLEHLVGAHLQDNQQILIQILDIGVTQPDEVRSAAMQRAAAIAEQGRIHAAAQGVTLEDTDQAIDDAIRNARQQRAT
jgi:hypothetical protein